MSQLKIILLIDEPSDSRTLILDARSEIASEGYSLQTESLENALALLDRGSFDIVICSFNEDEASARNLEALRKHASLIPIVTHGPRLSASAAVTTGADEHVYPERLEYEPLAQILNLAILRNHRWRDAKLNEERLRALVHANDDCMMIVDDSGTIRFANQAAERLFNSKSDELIGSLIGTPSGKADVEELLIVRHQTNETLVAEMRVHEIEWDGKHGYIESFRDVTRQRQEAQAARDAIRMRDHFLATLSHELRNPLAALNNAAQVLCIEQNQFPNLKLPVEIIQRQCHHMVRILDDLLDISRLSQGKLELRKEIVSFGSALNDCLQVLRPRIDRTHLLTTYVPSETLYVHADPSRLQQVMVNLLTNAAKYTPHGGAITVNLQRSGDDAMLRVSDNGHGIAPDLLNSIFEPFVQAQQTLSRSEGGLGIGLAVVRRLVELHGGNVTASSEGLGKGAEFTIHLPLSQARQDSKIKATTVSPKPLRICVVEDSADVAETMAKLLETLGHDVVTALDGQQAVTTVLKTLPNVVFLDIGLPDISGYEVAERIIKDPNASDVKLVALTGHGQPEDRRRAFASGFHYHLVKPVSFESLQSCLAEIAGTSQ